MKFVILLLSLSTPLLAQQTRYFTPHFQNMTAEKTEYVRKYTVSQNTTFIEDLKGDSLLHKATIPGLTTVEQVNAFAWYCISLGHSVNYREYFHHIKGDFEFYENGRLNKRIIIQGAKVKFAQVWNEDGEEVLVEGNGENRFKSNDNAEDVFEAYADSVLIESFGIRREKNDTIHYTCTTGANPKEGMQIFYQNLAKTLRYPGVARLAGKEGRIYVQFIVDKNGSLTDFTPLTNEGFNFEKKTIKKLESFPPWFPATFRGKRVKSKFILPVKFALTG
jgi:hypothetical protein